MKDRVVFYAIIASIAVHIAAAVVVGRTWAARLSVPAVAAAPRFIKVDLIDEPKPQEKPVKVSAPHVDARPKPPPPKIIESSHRLLNYKPEPTPLQAHGRASTPGRTHPSPQVSGDPGGALNVGSKSAHGDLPGDWSGGNTPVGWVPGDESGKGKGTGSGAGVGDPEPPKRVDDGPGTRPAAAPPPPPPPPKMIAVEVCAESGLLPGKHCQKTRLKSFVEGEQPRRHCDQCKEPFKSTLADRAEPVLERDSRLTIPSSVEEGLSLTVTVGYTVTATGDVTNVEVIKSCGNRAVDRAVVAAASKMKYRPAVQGGIPRSVKKTRTYVVNT